MSYQHPKLAFALAWKNGQAPGIVVNDGSLVEWPASAGPRPTDAEQAQAVADYEAYQQSPQRTDDELQKFLAMQNLKACGGKTTQAIVGVLIDKGVFTLAELRAKYRSL